jgi:hypothetical protein
MRAYVLLLLLPLSGCKEASPARVPGGRAPAADAGVAQSCEDRWLAAHNLNEYGDPQGTMYTGGTPLFDERTGQRKDRMEYVRGKQPELARACGGGGKDGG